MSSTCSPSFVAGARSDVGPRRRNNQDSGYISNRLLAVADGVGGSPAGHIASAIAVKSLVSQLESMRHIDVQAIEDCVICANANIAQMGHDYPQLRGMATTLTALVLESDLGFLIHVGDSRAYRYRDQDLQQMTVDQSWVQMMVDRGSLDPADAADHPMRNMLLHSLSGALSDPEAVVITTVDLCPGDRWLLASDGLTSYLPIDETTEQIAQPRGAQEVSEILVDLCWPRSLDNITVLIGDISQTTCTDSYQFVGAAEDSSSVRARVG